MPELYNFSKKQILCLTWWSPQSKYYNKTAIICDGAIRSGKTFCMSLSFVLWAFANFNNEHSFAICGKTIGSLKRNIIRPLIPFLKSIGISTKQKTSENYLDLSIKNKCLRFYFFGGKDEGSASLIQGITLAGILFDEVALMPRSFVEQGIARCSVQNSRIWFNCNPDNPQHWFYKEWILNKSKKKALYIHFKMKDNPSISKKILNRYKSLYSGAFYQRFVEGKWVASSGLIYPMFSKDIHVVKNLPDDFDRYIISCDYGTVNPASFGLWAEYQQKWFRIKEYYFDSKKHGFLKTDAEHYLALLELAGDHEIEKVIVDPSAASFIEVINRNQKFEVQKAQNDVVNGIRKVSDMLKDNRILFSENCEDSIREFFLYRWKDNSSDSPVKQNDHAMDDIRYFVSYITQEVQEDFFVCSYNR